MTAATVVLHWDGLNWQGSLVNARGQITDLAYLSGETGEDDQMAAADARHRWGQNVRIDWRTAGGL